MDKTFIINNYTFNINVLIKNKTFSAYCTCLQLHQYKHTTTGSIEELETEILYLENSANEYINQILEAERNKQNHINNLKHLGFK